MKHVLILGGTGLLGQAVAREAKSRGQRTTRAARSGADIAIDIADADALEAALRSLRPDIVFNCAAIADIPACERDPAQAYRVNARPLTTLAEWTRQSGARLIHVSTDHFFVEGGDRAHSETEPVSFVNEYARTKFAAEAFALTDPRALVFRTSLVGLRGHGAPTFAEWAIRTAQQDESATLFTDAYTSAIDVRAFARAAFDIAETPAAGLLNLASAEVFTKAAFVERIAEALGRRLTQARFDRMSNQAVRRASSLGLDVSRAQALLDWPLPRLTEVVASVVAMHREMETNDVF